MQKHEAFQQLFRRSIAFDRDLVNLPERTYPFLHLWILPSFSDACLWSIYFETGYQALRPTENTPYVREFRWHNYYKNGYRYDRDIVVRDAKLDRFIFSELMQEADQIAIPVVINRIPLVNDGEYYGIERTLVGAVGYRLTWSTLPPDQWQPLAIWHRKMTEYLVKTLDSGKPLET